MKLKSELSQLAGEITASQKILLALGDEVRQHLILVMMKSGDCSGMRVNDIAAQTSLSRPAVSHHLRILKDAGIVKMRKEGTMTFYYLDPDMEALTHLIRSLQQSIDICAQLPNRGGADRL